MPIPRRSTDDQVTATFLRGLTIGAIVGAVLAGSSLLARWRATAGRIAPGDAPPADGPTGGLPTGEMAGGGGTTADLESGTGTGPR